MSAIVFEHSAPHRGIGRVLVGLAHRRVHAQAARIAFIAISLDDRLAGHLGDEFGMSAVVAQCLVHRQRGILRLLELRVGDEFQFVHATQDVQLAGPGALWINHGVIGRRRLGQAGQHRRLGDIHLGQGLAVVDLRGRGEPVRALPQENLIDVQLEYFVFGKAGLDLVGK